MSDPYLGTSTLMRSELDALLPQGSAWQPVSGGDFDHLLSGIGDNYQVVKDYLAAVAFVRDPYRTTFLSDLEIEYGITPNVLLSNAQRRAILASVKFQRNRKSTASVLQAALDSAGLGNGGYGLLVFANDPPVDPGPFTTFAYQCVCGGTNAYCGYIPTGGTAVTAVCGVNGGAWIINGDTYTATPGYYGCGDTLMQCGYIPAGGGSSVAVCGYFTGLIFTPNTVVSPADPSTWPLVFFIAAGAVREDTWTLNDIAPLPLGMTFAGQAGAGLGGISGLTMASIPQALRQTLIEIILRWKPLHSWAALMVNFT